MLLWIINKNHDFSLVLLSLYIYHYIFFQYLRLNARKFAGSRKPCPFCVRRVKDEDFVKQMDCGAELYYGEKLFSVFVFPIRYF